MKMNVKKNKEIEKGSIIEMLPYMVLLALMWLLALCLGSYAFAVGVIRLY